jgi:hypothetical protein
VLALFFSFRLTSAAAATAECVRARLFENFICSAQSHYAPFEAPALNYALMSLRAVNLRLKYQNHLHFD